MTTPKKSRSRRRSKPPKETPAATSETPAPQPIDIARCIRESRQAPAPEAKRRPVEKILRFDPTTNPWDWTCDLANALRKLASDLALKWSKGSASDLDLAYVYYGSVVGDARCLLAEVSSQRDQVFGSPQLETVRPRVAKAVEILHGLCTEWRERDDYWQTHLAGPYDAKTLMEALSDELAKFEGYLERHEVIKELEDTAASLNTHWTLQEEPTTTGTSGSSPTEESQAVTHAPGSIKQKPDGAQQPSENGTMHLNVNIQNSTVSVGNIQQTQNLATGIHASIGEETPIGEQNKRGIKRTAIIVSGVVIFLAALLECLHYLGWLDPIKELIRRLW